MDLASVTARLHPAAPRAACWWQEWLDGQDKVSSDSDAVLCAFAAWLLSDEMKVRGDARMLGAAIRCVSSALSHCSLG